MPSRLAKVLVVLTLVLSVGAHWTFLQLMGWVGMTVSFARTDSVSVALEKTFSGNHPCVVCQVVQEGQASEPGSRAELPAKKEAKLEFLCAASAPILLSPPMPAMVASVSAPAGLGRAAPLLPPPRAA